MVLHLLSFTGTKVQILTPKVSQSSCRLCLRLVWLDPRSVLPAFFDVNVWFLCWSHLFCVEPPKGPSLIWQLQNWQMFFVWRERTERMWNLYVKFIWHLSLITWSLWLVHAKKNDRLKSEENLKSEKDKSLDVKEGSNRKCRGQVNQQIPHERVLINKAILKILTNLLNKKFTKREGELCVPQLPVACTVLAVWYSSFWRFDRCYFT